MARPDPPELERILAMAEPGARPVIRRLADLEARDQLTALETAELNGLRRQLEHWPATGAALAARPT